MINATNQMKRRTLLITYDFYNRYISHDDIYYNISSIVFYMDNEKGHQFRVDPLALWLCNEKRRRFKRAVFDPSYVGEKSSDEWNSYKGFKARRLDVECDHTLVGPFLRHIKEVIAAGDESYFHYVVHWMAHIC